MATTYTVVKGDTLWAIARKHSTTVDALVKLNNLSNPNYIVVGQKLIIDGDPVTPTPSVTSRAKITSYGLQADTDRTLVARWDWTKENTDHYLVRWWWGPKGQLGIMGDESTTEWPYSVYTAPANAERVSFYVKPISKTYKKDKKSDTEVHYWTADWTEKVTYYFKDNPPTVGSTPTATIKNNLMTITVNNLGGTNATHVEFQIVKDDGLDWITNSIPIMYDSVTYTCPVESGSDYKVRCRTVRDDSRSDWSAYSPSVGTAPSATSGITSCRASTSTSVYLAWGSVANADSYDIEYATKFEYFDSSDETTIKSGIKTANYTITGLESGKEYFFRVRAVNDNGYSAWSGMRHIVLGKPPAAPTTWSSTTTAITGEPLILYWVHNTEDGSKQTKAELELTVGGVTTTRTIPKYTDEEEEEETSAYDFNTSSYVEGTTLEWRVRTCGITGEYGDWSMKRTIDIYARPTLILRLTNSEGQLFTKLTNFPFSVAGIAGPKTQTPVTYHLSIISNETYTTTDHIGNEKTVVAGDEVYSRHFDIATSLSTTISANDADLVNNVNYTVNCIVCMDSGLTAETRTSFTVGWTDLMCEPNAEIGIDKGSYSAIIRPFCENGENILVDDVTLSVYRREYNGGFTEIATGLSNTRYTFVTDPHPSLDYARYRIVAISKSTGAVSYCDIAGFPVGEVGVIIQWNERWSNFDVTDDGVQSDISWSGSLVKIPYNIDVANSHSIDNALVEYIGRNHPVSYYGTQLGETATWSMEIPKNDKNTLYALRRLAAWTGDVYVREPSGSGYWANVSVSFRQNHCDVTIPVSLNIKRVEGGV